MKFETRFTLIKTFILIVFVLIICVWIFMGVLAYKGVTTVDERGLKGFVEQIWCGKQADCKLPV